MNKNINESLIMENKPQVAIFTTFRSADAAYSLNRVVQDQIKMLVEGGYRVKVLVAKGFKPIEAYALPDVEIFELPDVHTSNEGNLPEGWEAQRDSMIEAMTTALTDVRVVLTHDLISQPAHLIHNLAARVVCQRLPKLRWLHWIHSVFSSNMPSNVMEASAIGRAHFPNSFLVYPNSYDIPRVARNFGYEETDIKWVPHPTDVCEFFGMDTISRDFIKRYNILAADVVMVYPCRLDRGKQPHFLVEIAAALKKLGNSVRVIFMDFHSTGGDKVEYRKEMKDQAAALGLNAQEVLFFSEFDKKYEYEAPHQVVKDLMMVANIFIMPSRSETYSLVVQEAILAGNFVILNQDFLPFRSIFGDLPKYYQFGANIGFDGFDGAINTQYGNREEYMAAIAHYIRYMITYDKVLALKTKFRKERNTNYVFKNYLEPLLFAE